MITHVINYMLSENYMIFMTTGILTIRGVFGQKYSLFMMYVACIEWFYELMITLFRPHTAQGIDGGPWAIGGGGGADLNLAMAYLFRNANQTDIGPQICLHCVYTAFLPYLVEVVLSSLYQCVHQHLDTLLQVHQSNFDTTQYQIISTNLIRIVASWQTIKHSVDN